MNSFHVFPKQLKSLFDFFIKEKELNRYKDIPEITNKTLEIWVNYFGKATNQLFFNSLNLTFNSDFKCQVLRGSYRKEKALQQNQARGKDMGFGGKIKF